jgi:hypothetical protein
MKIQKTKKEIDLEKISQQLDAFGDKITNNDDYEKYKTLIEQEAQLQKDTLIETMIATTKFNKSLKKGEMPIITMPEIKFQNRSIRVEMKIPLPTKIESIKPTIIN